jgi:predicted nucleic acid-binding protein
MPETVVITDTSCLIVLTKLNVIDILQKMYSNIIVTPDIAKEFGETLPDWVKIMAVSNNKYQQILELTLDKGESSAIALALELVDVLLIIDDLKARKESLRLGLKITGTLGVLIKAKKSGYFFSIKYLLDKLTTIGFHISETLKNEILVECGE